VQISRLLKASGQIVLDICQCSCEWS